MSGDFVSNSVVVRQSEAESDVWRAAQLYDDDQCGMTFSINVNEDARRGNFTPDLLTADCVPNVSRFKAVAANTALVGITVFYFDGQVGDEGETCKDGNSAVIVISQWSTNETLAHELGHALSLEHPNSIDGMPPNDMMMSPASYPGRLTTGQCFRMNVNATSVLNTLPVLGKA